MGNLSNLFGFLTLYYVRLFSLHRHCCTYLHYFCRLDGVCHLKFCPSGKVTSLHLPQVPKVWTNCVHQTRFEASVVLVPRHQHCFGPNVFLLDSILRKRHERNPAPLQRLQCTNRQGSRLQHRQKHLSLTIILTKFIK